MIHHFTEYERIDIKGGIVKLSSPVVITCGAQSGEADNRVREVTCPECKRILKERKA